MVDEICVAKHNHFKINPYAQCAWERYKKKRNCSLLPLAKRGFQAKVPLEEIVIAVLYKLETGVQWHQLPVKSLFDADFWHGNPSIIIIVNSEERKF